MDERIGDDVAVDVVALDRRIGDVLRDRLGVEAGLEQLAHAVDESGRIVEEAALHDPISRRHHDLALPGRPREVVLAD